jgi:hypothetical protein
MRRQLRLGVARRTAAELPSLATASEPAVHAVPSRLSSGSARAQHRFAPGRTEVIQERSCRLIGRKLGLSKNTIADIVKRHPRRRATAY